MEGLVNLDDQIVDSEVWQQLSMDSIGECSNCSMLSLDAEALRVFENEESGWHTVGAPPDSTVPCSGSSSNSMQTPMNSFSVLGRGGGDDDDDGGGGSAADPAAGGHAPLPIPLGQRVFVNQGSMEGVPGNKSYGYFRHCVVARRRVVRCHAHK